MSWWRPATIRAPRVELRRLLDSFTTLLAVRHDVARDRHAINFQPLHVEASTIAEQRAPRLVVHVDDDAEALRLLVVPLVHVGDAAEEHRKRETEGTFVEALCARPETQAALLVDRQFDVDGQVTVRPEIID